jgi:acyl transferase domain-containing protein
MVSSPVPEGIAVVGMSGRFPKARNLEEFWRNLKDGIECVSFFSREDLITAGADTAGLDDPGFVNAGGVLDDIDLFDASFFGFSARDAEVMDPQQRIFLECAFHSLEDAGYDPETYDGLIGVFAGASLSSYLFDLYADPELVAMLDDFQVAIGNDKDHLATQVSYKLNLRGPSMAVQTACSTSLVAVCMACQSLLNYQCDIALAGGVSADASTSKGYFYQPGGILSPDGHCRVFDAAAKGTVVGNGAGVVVLKRLSEAIQDHDHIRAVIRGFALNNDGSQKVGYTAPSVAGQAQVIALAQAMARVDPETIGYVEAHGTGTELGDPIEMAALTQVFRARTRTKQFCAIGSVKSNIGHLDAAAGIASLIKTVLALENKALPPSLHFTQPNPAIDFANSPFRVAAKFSEWKSAGTRRAGVSCFGIGGTNAHVVVEEAPTTERTAHTRGCCVLQLSARTSSALDVMTNNLAEYLAAHSDADLANVAHTCDVGRKAFRHRRIVVCPDLDAAGAAKALADGDPRRVFTAVCEPKEKQIVYLFPGQGTQHINMAAGVYRSEPAFRREVDLCCELLRPRLGLDLRDLLYPADERRAETATALERTALTQPALFTVEYALAKLWMSWGFPPAAMIGHSIGEYVAACLAGVFSLEDALELVALRGQMMDKMPAGAMLAVALPEHAVLRILNDGLSLAAVNGPASCVVAGPILSVESLAEHLSQTGVPSQRLRTSHAFHSSMMGDVEGPFVRKVRTIGPKTPQIPFKSNVTGNWITTVEATDPAYWGNQLRQTVRFAEGLQQLCEVPDCILLEVGPGNTLSNLAKQQPTGAGKPITISSLPPSGESDSDLSSLLAARSKLWLHGVRGNPKAFYAHEQPRRVPLPGYPFERKSYWLAPSGQNESYDAGHDSSAKREVANWFYYPAWKPAAPADSSGPSETNSRNQRWLVFNDGEGIGSRLSRRLSERGEYVTTVVPGGNFERLDEKNYVIRPDEPADYRALLEGMTTGLPAMIVHLWSLSFLAARQSNNQVFEDSRTLGFDSLLCLMQALERYYAADSIRISVVSNEIQVVTGAEPLCPAKAIVLGLCKVIPQEYPNIRCQNIDVDFYGRGEETESRVAGELETELMFSPFAPAVALRKGRRWIQMFESVQLPEAEAPALRPGGVYLITGGLGKIGLVLAESLARMAQVKLVLTGRSHFPPRNEWQKWLRKDPTGQVSEKIGRLLQIEELGAEIVTFQADTADSDDMRMVVDEAEALFGPLNGIIHGAGDTSTYHSIGKTTRDAAGQQFRPKAAGLMVLDELLRGKDLDFVLLLSSLSSILGGLGLASYAAANIFMDALASQRNRESSVPWISVNWDAWEFPDGGEEGSGDSGILPSEGAEAFRRIVARSPRQVVVSVSDLQARLSQWVNGETGKAPESQVYGLAPQHSRPNHLTNPVVGARSEVENKLIEIWQQLLGVAPVGVFDNFFELGGHSLLAIQLISRIRETFRIEFAVHRVFEAPTIAELAESIQQDRTPAAENAETADILALVEHLSDSEIAALLDQEERVKGKSALMAEANGYD